MVFRCDLKISISLGTDLHGPRRQDNLQFTAYPMPPPKKKINKAKPKSNAQKTGYHQCSDSLFKKYMLYQKFIMPRCSRRIFKPISTRMIPPANSALLLYLLPNLLPITTPTSDSINVVVPIIPIALQIFT